jgi:N-terminal domain of reverse transcriptase
MTATTRSADAPLGRHTRWNSIEWKTVRMAVRRLQVRIAKAVNTERASESANSVKAMANENVWHKCPQNTNQPGCPTRVGLYGCLSCMTGNCHVQF